MRSSWRNWLLVIACLALLLSARGALAAAPAPPTGLNAVAQGSSQIALSWQPSAGAGLYYVYQGTSATNAKICRAAPGNSVTLTGLNPNTTYYYKVTAVSAGLEESAYSSVAHAKTAVGLPAPKGVKAVSSNGEIDIFWNAVPGADEYTVYRSGSSSGPYVFISATMSSDLAFADDSLPPNKLYYYKVRAWDNAGEGVFSACVSARTLPSAPAAPAFQALSASSVRLTWSAVPGATRYRVYRQNLSTGLYDRIAEAAKPSYVDLGLAPGVYRYYKVAAVNSGGEGPMSDAFWALPLPGVPANLVARQSGAATVHVEWDAVPYASQYRLYRATSPSGPFQPYYVNGATGFDDAGLSVGQTGYYKVSAVNLAGEGAASKVVSAKRTPGPASAPGSPKAAGLSSSAIKISWSAVPDATYYTIVRAPSASGPFDTDGVSWSTSYVSGSLKANTTYYYKVLPFNAADMGPSTAAFSGKTKAAAPMQPSNLIAAAEGSSAIRLSWSAAGAASGYRAYRYNPTTKKYTLFSDGPNLFLVDASLTAATAYKYQISAYNQYGESPRALVSCLTSETTIGPPAGLAALAYNYQSIDVGFSAVAGAPGYVLYIAQAPSSDITAYQAVSVTGTSRRISGLKAGTRYYFRVATVGAGNVVGQPSGLVSAQTSVAPPKPNAPRFYLATSVPQGDALKLLFKHPNSAADYPSGLSPTFELYVASSRAKLASAAPQVYDAAAIMTDPGSYISYAIPYGEAGWFGFRACFGPYKSDMQVVRAAALPKPVLQPPLAGGANLTLNWQTIAGATKYAIYISAVQPNENLSWYENKAQLTATGKLSFKGFTAAPTITLSRLAGATTMHYIVVPVNPAGVEGWFFGSTAYHLSY